MMVTTTESMAKALFIILLTNLLNEAIFCQACKLPLPLTQREIKSTCASIGGNVKTDGSILDKSTRNLGSVVKSTVGGRSKKDGGLTDTVSKSLGNIDLKRSGIDGVSGIVHQVGSGADYCLSEAVDGTLNQPSSSPEVGGIPREIEGSCAGIGENVKADGSILDKSARNLGSVIKSTVGGRSKADGGLTDTVSKSLGNIIDLKGSGIDGVSGIVNQVGSGADYCLSEAVDGTLNQLGSSPEMGGIPSEIDKTLGQVHYGAGGVESAGFGSPVCRVGTSIGNKLKIISGDSTIPGPGETDASILSLVDPIKDNVSGSVNGVVGGVFNSGKYVDDMMCHRPKTCNL